MERRIPASEHTREALHDLIEGRLSSDFGRTELVRLATRLIVEEGLEAEVRDALECDYYERGGGRGGGYRNGVRKGLLKTAEGFDSLPNARPIELSDSPRCQRSHISVFSAVVNPRRTFRAIATSSISQSKIKCCVNPLRPPPETGQ